MSVLVSVPWHPSGWTCLHHFGPTASYSAPADKEILPGNDPHKWIQERVPCSLGEAHQTTGPRTTTAHRPPGRHWAGLVYNSRGWQHDALELYTPWGSYLQSYSRPALKDFSVFCKFSNHRERNKMCIDLGFNFFKKKDNSAMGKFLYHRTVQTYGILFKYPLLQH